MKNDSSLGKSYGYYDALLKTCDQNGWKVIVANNHSKLILMDTDDGKYVLETSGNLNNNPDIEQFSFEKSDELFDFYQRIFQELEQGGILNGVSKGCEGVPAQAT